MVNMPSQTKEACSDIQGIGLVAWKADLTKKLELEGLSALVFDEDTYKLVAASRDQVRKQLQQDLKDMERLSSESSSSEDSTSPGGELTPDQFLRARNLLADDEKAHHFVCHKLAHSIKNSTRSMTARQAYDYIDGQLQAEALCELMRKERELQAMQMDDLSVMGIIDHLAQRERLMDDIHLLWPDGEFVYRSQTYKLLGQLPGPLFNVGLRHAEKCGSGKASWHGLKSDILSLISMAGWKEQYGYESRVAKQAREAKEKQGLLCTYCNVRGHRSKHCRESGASQARSTWLISSSSDMHVTGRREWLHDLEDLPQPVTCPEWSGHATQRGLVITKQSDGRTTTFSMVYYVPDHPVNALSMGFLLDCGMTCAMAATSNELRFYKEGARFLCATRRNQRWIYDCTTVKQQ